MTRRSKPISRALATLRAAKARIRELETQLTAGRSNKSLAFDGRLNSLLSISAALLVTRDIDAVLKLVVTEAAKLFPGSSGAMLFMWEESDQSLQLRAASGGPATDVRRQPGQGLAGRAFLAPRAMLVAGPEIEDAIAEIDNRERTQSLHLLNHWPPACALLAPLRIETRRIGSLVLYGGTHAHMLHPRDLPYFQSLADLAAVAITERVERMRSAELARDLSQSQDLHAQAQARLDAAQAQLLQSARLAAVGELSASIAHEINNPLYAARNSLYLLEQDLAPDAPQRAFLDIARNELGRIARIITRMRDFYRPARDELSCTDLNSLLEETLLLVQVHLRHGSVMVQQQLASNLPCPFVNADQIRQVMLNLILNACDAMPSGGTLTVSTVLLPSNSEQQWVELRISDTGIGISLENHPHLFEPFYTTKAQGTGLGLTITAHIVSQHGGSIVVESVEGQGATFIVRLPVNGAPADA
jgi:two-component system NtrC family sensor kinase